MQRPVISARLPISERSAVYMAMNISEGRAMLITTLFKVIESSGFKSLIRFAA